MARAQYLNRLHDLVFGETKKGDGTVPSILKIIERAIDHNIEYGLMKRLNFYDLKALMIEKDIKLYEERLEQMEKDRLSARGINRRKATTEDFENL